MASLTVVVVLCLLLLTMEIGTTGASSALTVTPATFNPVLASPMTLNCTFDYTNSTLSSVVSIILSRSDIANEDNPVYTQIASINYFAPNLVNLLNSYNASTSGYVSKDGLSFLSLHWEHPSLKEEGIYRCLITGLDDIGNGVEISHVAKITTQKPDIDDLMETIRQQQVDIENLQNTSTTVDNQINKIVGILDLLVNKQNSLENLVRNLSDFVSTTVAPLLKGLTDRVATLEAYKSASIADRLTNLIQSAELNGTFYALSKENNVNLTTSETSCALLGGYLAEIDDAGEMNFIIAFLTQAHVNNLDYIMIGGTDDQHEGQWVWLSSNRSLPYTDWAPGQPNCGTSCNCLFLKKDSSWQWDDLYCTRDKRFLCEVPKY